MLVQITKRPKPGALTLKSAKEITGGLSLTTKLGCYSISLDAALCNLGQHLAEQSRAGLLGELKSVCHDCYATGGNYHYPGVKIAMERRFAGLSHPLWAAAMVRLIAHYSPEKFRWHDSGDLVDVAHLQSVVEVARRLPGTRFWLPTREISVVREYRERYGDFPSNLCVRISGSFVDMPPQHFVGLKDLPTSTVHSVKGNHPRGKGMIECRAYERGGKCSNCTACFDNRVRNVSYPAH